MCLKVRRKENSVKAVRKSTCVCLGLSSSNVYSPHNKMDLVRIVAMSGRSSGVVVFGDNRSVDCCQKVLMSV